LKYDFTVVRIIDNAIFPTKITMQAGYTMKDEESELYDRQVFAALHRIDYFIKEVLDGCVIIDCENEQAAQSFLNETGPAYMNHVMLCPDLPSYPIIAELLMCKFNAIARDALIFSSLLISGTDSPNIDHTLFGDFPGDSFPVAEEWLTERNYFDKPWWERPDGSMMDNIPEADEDISEVPRWAICLDAVIEDIFDHEPPANVVVQGNFRPKVIEGDKE
jgi:hypothetical protein